LSGRWRAGSGIAFVLALAGCEGVPSLTFAGADAGADASETDSGSSDAGVGDSQVDASDGDDGSIDAGGSDSQVEGSVIDASGCRDDGGGQPPPNANACCGSVPCMGSNCLANCSRCTTTCIMPGALCCAKQPNNVVCRYLNAPPPCP
jgi:hypothetical protein